MQCTKISFYLIPPDLITWRDVEIKIDFQWKVIFDNHIPAFNFMKRWGFLWLSRAYLKTYNTASSSGIRFLFSHANNKLYYIFHSIYMNIYTVEQEFLKKIWTIDLLVSNNSLMQMKLNFIYTIGTVLSFPIRALQNMMFWLGCSIIHFTMSCGSIMVVK